MIKLLSFFFFFDSTIVKSSLVTNEGNFVTPTVVFDLTDPIYSKVFNFKNFAFDLDVS